MPSVCTMVQFLKCEITFSIIQRILFTAVFFLPVGQLAGCWFPAGRNHVVPDLPIVADPVLRVHRQPYAGFLLAEVIVPAAVNRVGDPGELAVNRAGNLYVLPCGFMLS
jgi:hypothetical protein